MSKEILTKVDEESKTIEVVKSIKQRLSTDIASKERETPNQ
jgi:hypothetical protein